MTFLCLASTCLPDNRLLNAARTEVLDRAGNGERLSYSQVREIVTAHDTRKRPTSKTAESVDLLKWEIRGDEVTAVAPIDLDAFAIEGAVFTVTPSKELRKGQPKFFTVGLLTDTGHRVIATKQTLAAGQRFSEGHFRQWRRQAAIPPNSGTAKVTKTEAAPVPDRDDIGENSQSELARLPVRIEELEHEVRRLTLALQAAERAAAAANSPARPPAAPAAAPPDDDGFGIPEFLRRSADEVAP